MKKQANKIVERKILSMYITGLIVGIMATGALGLSLKLGNEFVKVVALIGAALLVLVPPILLKIFESSMNSVAEPQSPFEAGKKD